MSVKNMVLLVMSILAFGYAGLIVANEVSQTQQSTSPALSQQKVLPPTEQHPDLLAIAKELNVDVSNITLKYTDFENPTKRAYFSYLTGGDTVSYMIELRPGLYGNQARKSFAHEYYHYVWEKNNLRYLSPALRGMYAADSVMHGRMEPYTEAGLKPNTYEFDNELFAIYCTEVQTSTLEHTVGKTCTTYVDISSIVSERNL